MPSLYRACCCFFCCPLRMGKTLAPPPLLQHTYTTHRTHTYICSRTHWPPGDSGWSQSRASHSMDVIRSDGGAFEVLELPYQVGHSVLFQTFKYDGDRCHGWGSLPVLTTCCSLPSLPPASPPYLLPAAFYSTTRCQYLLSQHIAYTSQVHAALKLLVQMEDI